MSKKILFLHGSPRPNGNTQAVAQLAIQAAKDANAQVDEINVTKLTFKTPGCIACGKCKEQEEYGCVIDDQLSETVQKILDYDTIVFAVPTYWMSHPAQVKMLIDRMGALIKVTGPGEFKTPLAGKTLAVMATAGGEAENNLTLLEQQVSIPAKMLSCNFQSCLFPMTPYELGGFTDDPEVAQKAQKFGKSLA